jgi:anti-anti-sigma regulatory factor
MYPTILPIEPLSQAPVASFTLVDLDSIEATQLVQALVQHSQLGPPQLVIDCSRLKCLRHLGVSHVVSQLLVFHQSGARVFLRNVEPVLQRCLQVLRLDSFFPVL